MIRTTRSVPEIEPLADEFTSRVKGLTYGFDREWWIPFWENLIDAGLGQIFVEEVDGEVVQAMGVMLSPYLDEKLELREAFWIVDEESVGDGRELLRAVEAWGRENGAVRFYITRLEAAPRPEALDRFYRMAGFEPVERVFYKEID